MASKVRGLGAGGVASSMDSIWFFGGGWGGGRCCSFWWWGEGGWFVWFDVFGSLPIVLGVFCTALALSALHLCSRCRDRQHTSQTRTSASVLHAPKRATNLLFFTSVLASKSALQAWNMKGNPFVECPARNQNGLNT